jgi:nitrite reductase/ring-hydroxylating ferredoxin subunit
MAGEESPASVDARSPAGPSTAAYAICALDDIPNRRARGFQLLRRDDGELPKAWSIFVVRWGSQAFGYVNVCPHHGVNLDWERNQFLDPSGLRIMCGKHGALFEIGTGRCVDGPCRGQSLEPIAVSVIDRDVCVSGLDLLTDDEEELHVP